MFTQCLQLAGPTLGIEVRVLLAQPVASSRLSTQHGETPLELHQCCQWRGLPIRAQQTIHYWWLQCHCKIVPGSVNTKYSCMYIWTKSKNNDCWVSVQYYIITNNCLHWDIEWQGDAVKDNCILLTELAGHLFLRKQVFRVHRPLEVLLQDGQDGGFFLWFPDTPGQQHVSWWG